MRRKLRTCSPKLRCVYTTPFGTPVLPLVKRIAAVSSSVDVGERGGPQLPAEAAHLVEGVSAEQAGTPPTVTLVSDGAAAPAEK